MKTKEKKKAAKRAKLVLLGRLGFSFLE
jgi:hypothetical protein